ncbi:Glycoside-Pentoside-Hexuronide (GPH):Cation Symporter Family [Achlya hypogyna]|uniref:Glycoside-Pentoside-Hexuronide (GPH):Cation Symporter Family n=1 Tax=Achlya hypogyna TaxID=1202772 RepID=A0A1V9YQU0_ACHHY|nr:Glycoside-Pentoside-Hexuronide (GPH):Cation Symporter Family [Achlya hypogyna]
MPDDTATTHYNAVVVKADETSAARRSCSTAMLILICSPRLALNMAWAAQWAALGPLLQILLPSSSVQLVQLVGPITGLLLAPSVGELSDSCTSAYGRRRPFLFWGAVASCLCWLVMMFCTEIGEALGDTPANVLDVLPPTEVSRQWTAAVVVLTYVWMDISLNLTQTPLTLLIADFAGDRQVTAASIGSAYSIAGSFVVSGYILVFGPPYANVKAFLSLLIAIMILTVGPVVAGAKESVFEAAYPMPSGTTAIVQALTSVFRGVLNLPRVLVVYCIIVACVQYGFFAYNGAKGQFFGLVVKNGTAAGADACGADCSQGQLAYNSGVQLAGGVTDTIYNCVSLMYLAALPLFVRSFGVQKVLTIAVVPQSLLIVMAFSKVVALDVAIVVGCGFTQNTLLSLSMPTILHVVGYDNALGIGLFAGAVNSAACLGQLVNFVSASILVTTSMGYALPILVGGIMSFVGFLVAAIFFRVRIYSA